MHHFWQNKKVIVTGAGGFIGGTLCAELLQRGAAVTGVVKNRKKIGNLASLAGKLTVKEADLTNLKSARHLIGDEKIIIHAASVDGGSRFKKEFAHQIFRDNVQINFNVLSQVVNKPIDRFVFISSAEVYEGVKKKKIKETDFSLRSHDMRENWYAWSKVIGEQTCDLVKRICATPILIVRPANIYGLGDTPQRQRLVPLLLASMKNNTRHITLVGSKQVRTFMYIDDFVYNLLSLIERKRSGVYNVAGKHTTRVKDFVRLFAKNSHLTITFKNLNAKNRTFYTDRFVLDVTKIEKALPRFYDSPYEDRIKDVIAHILEK